MRDPKLQRAVTNAQDAFHDNQYDYDKSSPHLRHARCRTEIEADLAQLVESLIAQGGECRAIEIGAGHGTFTHALIDAGAHVLVTEASLESANELRKRFAGHPRVKVVYDETGEESLASDSTFDLAVCVSVLHHIPDYLGFVDRLTDHLREGGHFYSVQDPLWYERVGKAAHRVHMGSYFIWRLGQGDWKRAVSTRIRRLRGVYDLDEPSDLVEYHVVRQGVDEQKLAALLDDKFVEARLFTYWSTQAPLLQWLGERSSIKTNFGLIARGRGPSGPADPDVPTF